MDMNNKKHVSLKDLAEELGVSVSTVSRALKDSPEVGEEMRERVKKLAGEWNYRPNPFAISLLKNNPRIIGIIVPDIVTHFYSSIISGISDVARKNHYSVIITSSYEQYELEKQCVEDLMNIRVEGIIACISQETTDYAHFESLIMQRVPLVFFDRVCLHGRCSCVVADNAESGKAATEHFLHHGAKRIGFIGGANHLDIVKQIPRLCIVGNYARTATVQTYPVKEYQGYTLHNQRYWRSQSSGYSKTKKTWIFGCVEAISDSH